MAIPRHDIQAAIERGDYVAALVSARPLAMAGDATAQTVLGVAYDNGQGVPRDLAQAAGWLARAGEQGFGPAALLLGDLYANGGGVPQDFTQAARWYRMAADKGLATAQCNLAMLYANGQGVPRDFTQAIDWFRRAAGQGLAQAALCLGILYAGGDGVPQDFAASSGVAPNGRHQGHRPRAVQSRNPVRQRSWACRATPPRR